MDYNWITNEMFDSKLAERLIDEVEMCGAASLLQIPGAYELFSEHFNNDVLRACATAREMALEEAGIHVLEDDDGWYWSDDESSLYEPVGPFDSEEEATRDAVRHYNIEL